MMAKSIHESTPFLAQAPSAYGNFMFFGKVVLIC